MFGLRNNATPVKSEVVAEINMKLEASQAKGSKNSQVYCLPVNVGGLTVNGYSLGEGTNKVVLKICFPDENFILEVEHSTQKELLKHRIRVSIPRCSKIDLDPVTNTLTIECHDYQCAKLSSETSTTLFSWRDCRISDFTPLDHSPDRLSLSIPMIPDISNRGLSERKEIMDRVSRHSAILSVGDSPYVRQPGQDPDGIGTREIQIFGPTKTPEQLDRTNPAHPAHPESLPHQEEKVFEEQITPQQFKDYQLFEQTEIAKKSIEDKIKMLNGREEVIKFSKLKGGQVLRCPIYGCFKQMTNIHSLKSHITRSHKELEDSQIDITQSGRIKWPPQLVDNLLRVLYWQKKFVQQQVVKRHAEKKYREIEARGNTLGITNNGNNA